MIAMDESSRVGPLLSGPERDQLESWLDFYRSTLLLKCAGLSVEQLSTRAVPSSDLTLLGLLRHMTFVEQVWFEKVFAGRDIDDYYKCDDDRDADFHDLSSSSLVDVACVVQWTRPRRDGAGRESRSSGRPSLDLRPHDRGVRPALRPRRPAT